MITHARWRQKNILFSGYVQSKKHHEILSKKSAYLAVKEKKVIYIMLASISKLQEWTWKD